MESNNRELFGAIRDHLNRADLSNTEQFDRAILTLSSAGLAFSIALMKLVPPLSDASYKTALWLSWGSFAAAIVLTVVSFMTTSRAIKDTRHYAYKYYMESNDGFADKISIYSRITHYLNRLSGLAFVVAVVATLFFFGTNIQSGSLNMNGEKKDIPEQEERGYVPPPLEKKPDPPKDDEGSKKKGS